jgi:hypothetical protein
VSEILANVNNNIQLSRLWLKTTGSAHLEWSFLPQIIYLEFLVPAMFYVVVAPVYMRYHELAHFSWVRWLLDEQGECEHRLIMKEFDSFCKALILSSQITLYGIKEALDGAEQRFVRSKRSLPEARRPLRASRLSLGALGGHQESVAGAAFKRNELMRSYDSIFDRCNHTFEQLKRIALDGRLNPLHRTRDNLYNLAFIMLASVIAQHVLSGGQAMLFYCYVRNHMILIGKPNQYLTFMDAMEAVRLTYVTVMCFVAIVPVTSVDYVSAYDQLKISNSLRALIQSTIHRSERTYRKLLTTLTRRDKLPISLESFALGRENEAAPNGWRRASGGGGGGGGCCCEPDEAKLLDSLELDLLDVIIQYRLFAAEYKLAMRPNEFYGIMYVHMCIGLAVIVRTHGQYILAELRFASILMGYWAFLAPFMLYMLPLCFLQRNCLVTYKSLYSLMAQSAYYEPLLSLSRHTSLKFALLSIRRELIEPKQTAAKFTCRLMVIDATFATLIKITFWVLTGLVQLMKPFDNDKSNGFLEDFLSDPSGIYSVVNKITTGTRQP